MDNIFSTEKAFLIEIVQENLKILRDYFFKTQNKADWLLLERYFEHNYVLKNIWRQNKITIEKNNGLYDLYLKN